MARIRALEWSGVGRTAEIEPQWGRMRQQEGEAQARALTLNLICRAQDAADAARVAEFLWELGPRHPARVFVLAPGGAGGGVRVAAHAQGSELVELAATPERAASAVSLVAPLLISDLPVVLLWRGGDPHANREFQEWAAMADRVLVDAHRMRLPPAQLAALAQELPARASLCDLTWTRLTPWRQLLCQGLEAEREGSRRIRRVSLTAGHGRQPTASLAATLFAGWLAHLLHWTPQERLGVDALRLRDAAGEEVTLRFQPCPSEERHGLLRRLVVEGEEGGMSVVVQHRGERLSVNVRGGGRLLGEWAGPAASPERSEAETLNEELSIHGRDLLYQPALECGLALIARLEAA